MPQILTARTLLTPEGPLHHPILHIEDGLILSIEEGAETGSQETLAPAFFDIHVHGAKNHDFMAADAHGIAAVGRFLATRGVAHYLPTTVTGPIDPTLRALERLAEAIETHAHPAQAAIPVGIHLEGPFVSEAKRGVHPAACILPPDIPLFDRFQTAARGHVRLITLAPELPGALDLIAHATATGVRVSLGHSNATAAETLAGIAAGATSATHLFNAMRPIDHREPGIAATILDRPEHFAEMICDGIHVDPVLVRLWFAIKGPHRAILVSDGMSATGMPDGTYALGDLPVEVRNGRCLSNGTLAGSTLTLDRAVENLRQFTAAPLATAIALASHNPAAMLGMSHLTAVAPGAPANFTVFDPHGRHTGTILRGHRLPSWTPHP